jgi:hypothetical protein
MNLIGLFSLLCSLANAEESNVKTKMVDVSIHAGLGVTCILYCSHIDYHLSDEVHIGITGSVFPTYDYGFVSTSIYTQLHIPSDSDVVSRFFTSFHLGVFEDNTSGASEVLPYIEMNIGYEQPIGETVFIYSHLGISAMYGLDLLLPDGQIGLGFRI